LTLIPAYYLDKRLKTFCFIHGTLHIPLPGAGTILYSLYSVRC
jgi:hypothetical protein